MNINNTSESGQICMNLWDTYKNWFDILDIIYKLPEYMILDKITKQRTIHAIKREILKKYNISNMKFLRKKHINEAKNIAFEIIIKNVT